MLASAVVSMTAASRGKVRSLVSLSRRLATNQRGSPDTPPHPPPETSALLPDIEPDAAEERIPRRRKDPSGCSVLLFPRAGQPVCGHGERTVKVP
ncbi:malonyl-CoA-acyl carrier protein transacylase, mitochondrial [Lates japonicus]|uniref:Malonyl-CoA-acyl carrier protein transacylase, mitochondrial n=1 Tax=Lates japonicus TaxID=270547 RepID=A0AAD3M6T7_LATJO|nr:malonyl-CoA-acyl carrier protein transacylase, mitochondrial [Lates japonicus]